MKLCGDGHAIQPVSGFTNTIDRVLEFDQGLAEIISGLASLAHVFFLHRPTQKAAVRYSISRVVGSAAEAVA